MNKAVLKIGMFIGLAIISTVVSASAQNVTRGKVEIPFDFTIGQTDYVAGEYAVIVDDYKMLTIADKAGKSLFTSAVSANSAVMGTMGTKFTFNRYEDHYFLTRVASENFGLKLERSRGEREMAENRGMPMKTVSIKTK